MAQKAARGFQGPFPGHDTPDGTAPANKTVTLPSAARGRPATASKSPWASAWMCRYRGSAGRRLLHHHQVSGGNAGFTDRPGQGPPRCGAAARRLEPRLRGTGGDLRILDPGPDDPQGVVHRFGVGRQASQCPGNIAHEASDHGLGGHAPVLVFDHADVEGAAKLMGAFKYRNAGQVCVSPTRFFVHDKVYDNFVGKFINIANKTRVGDGLDPDSRMGPLANPRRINAIEVFVADAQDKGAKLEAGGKRIGNQGNFFEPTVLSDVPENARIMSEEPFGPIAVNAALQGD